MNRHILELVELSKTDKEINSYQPQIEELDKNSNKAKKNLDEAHKRVEKIKSTITENDLKVATYEEQLKTLNQHLTDNSKKLKNISTEKEMKALAIEEDITKEKMSFANEEIERLQVVNQKKQEEVAREQEEFATLQSKLSQTLAEVEDKKAQIEASKVKLFTKREESIRKTEQTILEFYERIRKWAGNTAVVEVKKQACYGCYIKLNDKTYADVIRGEEIQTCPHCGRILYIEKETLE